MPRAAITRDMPQSSRYRAILLAALSAAAPLAFFVDMPLARFMKLEGVPGDVKNIVRLAEVFAHGSGVLLILLACAALDPRSWRVLPRLAMGAYGAGWLADLLKLVLSRRRPNVMDVTHPVSD